MFVVATYLLGSAFASRSPYEFLLSVAAYCALLVAGLLCRLQAYRFSLADFEWNTGPSLHARGAVEHSLSTRSARAMLFFRIHFGVGWKLQAGHRATLFGYREVAGVGGTIPMALYLPASGIAVMRSAISVRDIFGLCRAQLRPIERRELTVLPGLLGDQSAPPVDISVGYDTTQRAQTADEEKYFMREYIVGDRLKDINWKASSRLNEMITRISPVTQERTQLLHVVLRPYRRPANETLASILHLDFAKSWMITFLRVIKQNHPEYTFRVDTGDAVHQIDAVGDIDPLARSLARVHLRGADSSANRGDAFADGTGHRATELFVFTTLFDADLPHFITAAGARRAHVFRTSHAEKSSAATRAAYRLCLSDSLLPGSIGGAWSWRTEWRAAAPPALPSPDRQTTIDDQPLAVRYACTLSS